jgi:isochorismate hydrolase
MKEIYFTENTIDEQSLIFQQRIDKYHKKRIWNIVPKKTALLILDMQNFFLSSGSHAFIPSAAAIIPKINKINKELFQSGGKIIFTRHLNTDNNAMNMGTWWQDILTESDTLSKLSKNLQIKDNLIIHKSQYDAFYKTNLEEILVNAGISQLIISGVMTHLCCETTARSAFVRGFEVFFGIDMTATYNKSFHTSSLINLSHGFATPILSDEIIKSLNDKK